MSESLCGFGNVISGSLHLPETKGIAIIVFPPECKSRRFCQKLCVCVCQVEIENVTRPSRNQFESVPLNDVCVFSNRFFRLSVAGVCWINMDDGRALKRSVGLARFSFFFFIRTAIALFARLHPHDDGCLFFFRNLLHPLIHFDVDRPVPKKQNRCLCCEDKPLYFADLLVFCGQSFFGSGAA